MTPTADDLARDPYELANQLSSYIGPDTPEPLAEFLRRQSAEAVRLADLLTALEARQAQLLAALREIVAAEDEGAGLYDRIDNCGQRYQSQGLADTLRRARTLIKETGNG